MMLAPPGGDNRGVIPDIKQQGILEDPVINLPLGSLHVFSKHFSVAQ